MVKTFIEIASKFLPKEQLRGQIEQNMLQGKLLDFHQIRLIDAYKLFFDKNVPILTIRSKTALSRIVTW